MMYFQDVDRSPNFKFDGHSLTVLALNISKTLNLGKTLDNEGRPLITKGTSGSGLEKYYSWWRENVAKYAGIRLDEKRLFDDEQKRKIFERDSGRCSICGEAVVFSEAEFDHYPIAHCNGGPTTIENGRTVHKGCHPRGREKNEDWYDLEESEY